MYRTRLSAALACACVLSLSACDKGTPEDRINEAVPVSMEVTQAKDRLLALAEPAGQKAAIEQEFAARMKLRAIECAHDYVPADGDSTREIRDRMNDRVCLAAANQKLQDWLGARSLSLIVAAPPLRPVPKEPQAAVTIDAAIQGVEFADEAGVALLTVSGGYRVVDLGSGETISNGLGEAGSLSPNGRLLATRNGHDVVVLNVEDGSALARFKEASFAQMHWIGSNGLLYSAPKQKTEEEPYGPDHELVYLDLASGTVTPLGFSNDDVHAVVPRRWKSGHYLLFAAYSRLGEIVVEKQGPDWKARLESDTRLQHQIQYTADALGANADGAWFYGRGEGLQLVDLTSMQETQVSLGSIAVTSVAATPDPDQLLVIGITQGAPTKPYLYSISKQTLAEVTAGQFAGTRFAWSPALKRTAIIDSTRLLFPGKLQTAAPVALASLLQQHQVQPATEVAAEQANDAAYRAAEEELARKSAESIGVAGPVADLGKNATIETIGVYEGLRTSGGSSRNDYNVPNVQVHVRKTSKPMILVLASYERVNWVVTLEAGANLAAILNSGYYDSQVFGGGDAKVFPIGREYAYQRNSRDFEALDRQVKRWTGQSIGHFQGDYHGNVYFVGR